jgi:Fe-S-cluster-containing dehydrogenase component
MLLRAGGDGNPHANPERGVSYPVLRSRGTVEKCTFCDHRLVKGLQPACVEACPAHARVAGDLDDPQSEVAQLLRKHMPRTLRSELGTRSRVFYIRAYKPERRG